MIRLFYWLSFAMVLNVRAASLSEPRIFTGVCDASAAVVVTDDLFAVANDEDNLLRFYRWSQPGKPVRTDNLNSLLSIKSGKKKAREIDVEAAARLGSHVFWITSHGRNAKGESAPDRFRFFALDITNRGIEIIVEPAGKSYTNLLVDLSREPKLSRFKLAEAAKLAPKEKGALNIEALTATPDGTLLIGFRNPIPQGRALMVPLLNPNDLLTGNPPRFGDAILLDLGGLGLRGMESTEKGYFLLAGPADEEAVSRLFFWSGGKAAPQLVEGINFPGINPEGICVLDAGKKSDLLILSDDGGRNINGKDCKDLPESERQFRAYRLSL